MPLIPLFLCFADADDGVEADLESSDNLLGDECIRFQMLLPAFAVTTEDVLAPKTLEHRHTNVAGVCPLRLWSTVLCTNGELCLETRGDMEEGREDDDIGTGLRSVRGGRSIPSLGGGRHFPVRCKQQCPFHGDRIGNFAAIVKNEPGLIAK